MAHIDPNTESLIPNGVLIVQCPNGHINRADSWTAGNRCHHPGCNYIGDPSPVTDPFQGNPIPNGVPIVQCPNGHINCADSWAEGNRCHYSGCDYIGDPLPVSFTQPQNAAFPQPPTSSTIAPATSGQQSSFPPSYSPGDIQVITSSPVAQFENTSGTGANAVIPPEIRGLCWGAFLLNFLWCIGNRAWLTAFMFFVPLINFLIPLVLLFKGNEWAWRKRRWRSTEQFKRAQRVWTVAGIIIYALAIVLTMQEGMMLESIVVDQMQQRFLEGVQYLEELLIAPIPGEIETQVVTPEVQEENLPLVTEDPLETPQSQTPTPTADSPLVPQVRVSLSAVNIRAGPGTNYAIIGLAEKDSLLTVLATDAQRGWFLVRLEDGNLGWVGTTVVEPVNSLQSVKIAATIPPLPPEE